MRDALGGLVNIVLILVFLVLVSGYLAFNINYTKAFRVKNKVITTIEQYEGKCKIDDETKPCGRIIHDYKLKVGYNSDITIDGDSRAGEECNKGVCIKENKDESSISSIDGTIKVSYRVKTFVVIDIPIIRNILTNFEFFQVTGDTKTFKTIRS